MIFQKSTIESSWPQGIFFCLGFWGAVQNEFFFLFFIFIKKWHTIIVS